MLIILKPDATPEAIEQIRQTLQQIAYNVQQLNDHPPVIFQASADGLPIDTRMLEGNPAVERILTEQPPYKLVSRAFRSRDTTISLGEITLGGGKPVLIAGPCAVENEAQIRETARLVYSRGVRLFRGGAFKPRTSPYSFRGLKEAGLKLLQKVRQEFGLYVVTEVLDPTDVPLVSEYADILQIGSRNMQNFALLEAVGRTNKPVLLKRGMSATLTEFLLSAEYILQAGNEQVILCERGIRTFVEYSRNTLDLNIVPMVKEISHLPIIVDPSHGTGRRNLVIPLALAALAVGADGVMVEVHPNPPQALSDAQQALYPEQFVELTERFQQFVKNNP